MDRLACTEFKNRQARADDTQPGGLVFFAFMVLAVFLVLSPSAKASDQIRILKVTDYQEAQQLLFDSQTRFHLPESLIKAIHSEVTLSFQTDILFTEQHRFWGIEYSRERAHVSYQTLLRYSSFHNHYILTNRRNQNTQTFSSLQKALETLGTLAAFPVIDLSELHPGQKYILKLRIHLNPWRLPAPLVLHSLWNPDWQLDSDWFETTLYTPKSWM